MKKKLKMEGLRKLSIRRITTFTIMLCLLLRPAIAGNTASEDDADIMSKIAKSLSPSGWSGDNPCGWTGVGCDSSGHVTRINLARKSLSGQIPPEITQLKSLTTLSLQSNQLSGPFPSLVDLPQIQTVFLDNNNFSSVPTPFLKGLTSLQSLSLGDNPNLAPWSLPATLADSTGLTNLTIGSAKLTGELPDIFGALTSLQNVRLSYNNLSGSLPPSLANSKIRNLWVNNQAQGLSGRINMLGSMTELNQVWLHGNKFIGPIPDLSAAKSLSDLSLRDNRLTGPVPTSITTLPKLVSVSLQNNKLQGPFPSFPSGVQVNLGTTNNFCNSKPGPCDPQVTMLLDIAEGFGYPVEFATSWLGNNPCQGWRSVSCDSSGKVTALNFGKQGLVGHISPAMANMSTLTTVNLNDNNLTGTIPPEITKLQELRVLDVSNNNISGKVPAFSSGVSLKTSGNPFIGKDVPIIDPTTGTSSSAGSSSRTSTNGESEKSSTPRWVIIVVVVIVVLSIGALLIVISVCVMKKRKKMWARHSRIGKEKSKSGEINALNGYGESSRNLPILGSDHIGIQVYDGGNVSIPIEVLREVTDNFSEDNVLGRGGFGIVYSGELQDGTKIAVKRMEAAVDSTKGLNEFQAEIAVLSKVRHRHLVALYGFCIHGNERLLVYEHMPQGTLAQRLFSYREMGVPSLTWKQRLQIALDVARGVEYLHGLAQSSFIHRDLKPSNVLLGDDLRAKVSDFGLVKNAPDGKYSMETRLAGTFGYLAPEYASTGRVTTKIDVFAYGVILMEIITGRKALDDSLPEDRIQLVTWFRKNINHKDSIRTHLDPSLDPDEETFDSICKVTELSGHCTSREPQQRPDMGHAVNVLSPLVDQWKPTSSNDDDSFGIDYNITLPQALQKWQAGKGNSLVMPSGYMIITCQVVRIRGVPVYQAHLLSLWRMHNDQGGHTCK